MFFYLSIDSVMGQFPLVSKDMVVLHHHLLDLVGRAQDLLMIPLSICLDVMNLHAMSIPLPLHVVHLKERD